MLDSLGLTPHAAELASEQSPTRNHSSQSPLIEPVHMSAFAL